MEQLLDEVPEWTELAGHALEPNAYSEPWFLLPAARAFGRGSELLFVFVYGPDPQRPFARPRLCGLFPLERTRRYKGLPVACLRLWKHLYCYLCTPLLHRDCAREALEAFLDWLAADGAGAALMEWWFVPGQGPFHQLLMERLYDRGRSFAVEECYPRALFEPAPGENGDAYLRRALNSKRRTEYARHEKHLAGLGKLEYAELQRAEDVSAWVEAFLRLEASGWKGAEGTALGSREPDRTFFREAVAGAFASGRLMLLGLFLDGRPVALKCNFWTPPGGYAFKIAYDESFARYSPGMLLELETMRRLPARPGFRWMDSCAMRVHPMINRLWLERRLVQTLLHPTGRTWGEIAFAVLPLLRWLKRLFSRRGPIARRDEP
jgi:hypothetical protein